MARLTQTERRLLALLSETSVHAGVGAQLGAVDLPIQRERHTEWPTIYGSGIKGVLRDHARAAEWGDGLVDVVFGPESTSGQKDEDRHSGALAISDAQLVLFPVRTVGPAFAWVTCPLALARLRRNAEQAGVGSMPVLDAAPTTEEVLVTKAWPQHEKGVLIEEFQFKAQPSEAVAKLGDWMADHLFPQGASYQFWRDQAKKHVVVVADDEFRDFVRHATEVVTRVRLDDTSKTVAKGALWTEENLPADSLLVSFVAAWQPAKALPGCGSPAEVMTLVGKLLEERRVVQIGGKETVGRGFMAARLSGGNGHGQTA